MITNAAALVGLRERTARPTLMTVKTALVLMEECVWMEFKVILVFVKLDLLEKTALLLSMNANLRLVFKELAQIYLMTTAVPAALDILGGTVQC